jgi:hypothetical protein
MPKLELGKTMYLFTRSSEVTFSNILVISAHGGIAKKSLPTYQVPVGVTLQFYSKHGTPTADFGIHNFATGGKVKQQTDSVTGGNLAYDYELSKYQGKHSKAEETYESIEKAQKYPSEYQRLCDDAAAEAKKKGVDMPKLEYQATDFDVLTIRNRMFGGGVTLSVAVDAALEKHAYTMVHCYFCRSFI